jgi:hypothetical protein
MTILGPRQLAELGFGMEDLVPAAMRIVPEDDNAMQSQGMLLVKITGKTLGREFALWQQAYVCGKGTHLFVSRECMVDLGVIGEECPAVGSAVPAGQVGVSTQEELFHQEEEAEVPGQPHQSLASGGVPARPGTKRAETELLVEGLHPKEGEPGGPWRPWRPWETMEDSRGWGHSVGDFMGEVSVAMEDPEEEESESVICGGS